MVLSPSAAIRARTSSWVKVVQRHMPTGFGFAAASPTVATSRFSTNPVQEPQEAEALVCCRTSSEVVSPFSVIARVIVPLQTPLQPQI